MTRMKKEFEAALESCLVFVFIRVIRVIRG